MQVADLKVTHQRNNVVAGADFYPFGLAMENREITRENYRYGYQGQYAEKDKETGWNAFELRMYDGRVGRWTSVDPKGQFNSPYVGMGNNPVSGTDPDGGWSWITAGIGFGVGAGMAALTGHGDDWWKWGLGTGLVAGASFNQPKGGSFELGTQNAHSVFGGISFNSDLYNGIYDFFNRPGLDPNNLITRQASYAALRKIYNEEFNRKSTAVDLDVKDDSNPKRVLVLPNEGHIYRGSRRTRQFSSYNSYTEQTSPLQLIPNRYKNGVWQIKIHRSWLDVDGLITRDSWLSEYGIKEAGLRRNVKRITIVREKTLSDWQNPFDHPNEPWKPDR